MKKFTAHLVVCLVGTAAAIGVAICIPSSTPETDSLLAVSVVDRT
ncbi:MULTISPECIES: hypothetical protein [unclassified Streptomyces]|nr:hypothetical protein [Streptomyces sp. NBC_01268]